jgi:predicted DCC family thiol-disulfide oxidoreductase YuxK
LRSELCRLIPLVARNRYRWFGRRDACILPNSDRSWPS